MQYSAEKPGLAWRELRSSNSREQQRQLSMRAYERMSTTLNLFWLPMSPLAVGKYKESGSSGAEPQSQRSEAVLQHWWALSRGQRGDICPSVPSAQRFSTQGLEDLSHSQPGQLLEFQFTKQGWASFCWTPWMKWRQFLRVHLPRVQSGSIRCLYYLLDGKLWLLS